MDWRNVGRYCDAGASVSGMHELTLHEPTLCTNLCSFDPWTISATRVSHFETPLSSMFHTRDRSYTAATRLLRLIEYL